MYHSFTCSAVVASLAAHRSDVGVLAVMAPLALLATGGADGNIKLWQLPAPDAGGQHPQKPLALKEPRQKLRGHAGELSALHFTPDGEQLISGDSGGGGTIASHYRGVLLTAIQIQGHTDNSGSESYNKKLSVRRATAVSDYLPGSKIATNRNSIKGYGQTVPKYNKQKTKHEKKKKYIKRRQ